MCIEYNQQNYGANRVPKDRSAHLDVSELKGEDEEGYHGHYGQALDDQERDPQRPVEGEYTGPVICTLRTAFTASLADQRVIFVISSCYLQVMLFFQDGAVVVVLPVVRLREVEALLADAPV